MDLFDLIINADTNNYWSYLIRGKILQYFNMLPEAQSSFMEALKIRPTDPRIKEAIQLIEDERNS